jgi:hypothetical protein
VCTLFSEWFLLMYLIFPVPVQTRFYLTFPSVYAVEYEKAEHWASDDPNAHLRSVAMRLVTQIFLESHYHVDDSVCSPAAPSTQGSLPNIRTTNRPRPCPLLGVACDPAVGSLSPLPTDR